MSDSYVEVGEEVVVELAPAIAQGASLQSSKKRRRVSKRDAEEEYLDSEDGDIYEDGAMDEVVEEDEDEYEMEDEKPKKKSSSSSRKSSGGGGGGGGGGSIGSGKRVPHGRRIKIVTSKNIALAVYQSAAECERRTGINHCDVGQVCSQRQARTRGYIFRYAEPEDELNQLSKIELENARMAAVARGDDVLPPESKFSPKPKKVMVVTTQGTALAVYESINEAERRTKISIASISGMCNGRYNSQSKGFSFRFADPDAVLNQLSYDQLLEAKQTAIEQGLHAASETRNYQRKKVHVITSKGVVLAVYDTITDAENNTGFGHSKISASCQGKRNHVDGFIFQYAEPGSITNPLSLEELQEARRIALERGEHVAIEEKNNKARKVQVITSQGHILAVYKSKGEASRNTGISDTQMSLCCQLKRSSVKGFIFRHADPLTPLNQLSEIELSNALANAIKRGEHVVDESKAHRKHSKGNGFDDDDDEDDFIDDDDDEDD